MREAGTAEVFDSDGNTLVYESEDTARAMLMDAEFVAFDGLDEDDALARGFSLDEIVPPQGDATTTCLREHMMQQLGARSLTACTCRAPSPKPTSSISMSCWPPIPSSR